MGMAAILAITKTVVIIEAVIVAAIIVLLVTIVVMNRRKKQGGKAPATAPNYYADLQQQQPSGQPDPFAGFGGPGAAPGAATAVAQAPVATEAYPAVAPTQVAVAPPPPPPPAAASALPLPPPGTPAGWLQDPSGTPDTLRYWDGNAWTPHVAQRT